MTKIDKESETKMNNILFDYEELSPSDFQISRIEPNKIVQNQSDTFDGLKIVLEGECYVSCDTEKVRELYPDLMTDYRKPVVNIVSLKKSLNKLIIPSIKDHDAYNNVLSDEKPTYKGKYFRSLTVGDKIGDFEISLKLKQNLFKITNSSKPLLLAHISLSSLQKLLKRAPQFFQKISETALLKCSTYINEKELVILFDNIKNKLETTNLKKPESSHQKISMTDFEATLKLYEQNSSELVPSYIPNSMNMMWKMKQSESFWRKKIEDRKTEQDKENQIKINYFRSPHRQSARSNKALEKLKENNDCYDEKLKESSRFGVITSAKIPINHPSVSSVWTILKAVNRFKHKTNHITTNKIAKSKSQIAKTLHETSIISNGDLGDDELKEVDFDAETSDKNLSAIEYRMRKFVNSFPKTTKTDGISNLKRFVVDGKSIPQLGGTILVRYKHCNPHEEHEHIQHFILPKDALSTLQKYRASRPHTTEQTDS